MTAIHSSNPFIEYLDYADSHEYEFSVEMLQQLHRQREMLKLYDFIEEKGKKACDWIERFCKITEGENAGKPVKLLLSQKWFIYSILCFYGYLDIETYDDDGNALGTQRKYTRIVNDVLYMVGTGNGKTSLLGFLNAYFLFSDEFNACKIYIGSNAYKQSRLCFDTTMNIIRGNKALRQNCNIRSSYGEIEVQKRNSRLTAMSSDGANLEGIIPAVLIIDEIHEMKDRSYADNLRKSTKRDDFLIIETTTQGTVRGGYLDERLEQASILLSGNATINDYRKLFCIYKQDSEDEIDINNMAVCKKSNPALGVAVSVLQLKQRIIDMINDPRKRTITLTKNFNIPQNPITSYFTDTECKTKEFDESIFYNAPVFLGLDMAYTRTPESDLACLEMMLYNPITEEEYCKDFYFLPKYWDKETHLNGQVDIERLNMIKEKSKEDSNILYNERQKVYGYQLYADRGDVIIVNEELREELVSEFGEHVRKDIDLTGITENFILLWLAHLERKYNWIILKFGLDPNKASTIQAVSDVSIPSQDGKLPTIKFRMEDKRNSNPIILSTKDIRARGLVYNNNRLSELHFVAAQRKEDLYGNIVFTNAQREKKDGVIANLCARSACNVFLNNKDTGERNRALLSMWWNERESLQNSQMEENKASGN